jgi:hypothetical protein
VTEGPHETADRFLPGKFLRVGASSLPLVTTLTGLEDTARISMAEVGEPTQSGSAERLMRTSKEEEVDLSECRDSHDVCQHIGQFIEVADRTAVPL